MDETLRLKVTQIRDRWHVRLIEIGTDKVLDEMACDDRRNIGFCCAAMLRWAAKLGNPSPMARASRRRGKRLGNPGRVWYRQEIEKGDVRLKCARKQADK
jgi:hypothetical protein